MQVLTKQKCCTIVADRDEQFVCIFAKLTIQQLSAIRIKCHLNVKFHDIE